MIAALIGYLVLRLQHLLFFTPNSTGSMAPDLSFNTIIGFITNTNLQHYCGQLLSGSGSYHHPNSPAFLHAGGLLLVWQGVPQNLRGNILVDTLEGAHQIIATGPVAALEIIKHLGTNGGGFLCNPHRKPHRTDQPD